MGMDQFEQGPLYQPRKAIEESPALVQPEPPPRSIESIIPFPGVSIDHEVTYQKELDGFLRELGYID
jgi:hypothetical protein